MPEQAERPARTGWGAARCASVVLAADEVLGKALSLGHLCRLQQLADALLVQLGGGEAGARRGTVVRISKHHVCHRTLTLRIHVTGAKLRFRVSTTRRLRIEA